MGPIDHFATVPSIHFGCSPVMIFGKSTSECLKCSRHSELRGSQSGGCYSHLQFLSPTPRSRAGSPPPGLPPFPNTRSLNRVLSENLKKIAKQPPGVICQHLCIDSQVWLGCLEASRETGISGELNCCGYQEAWKLEDKYESQSKKVAHSFATSQETRGANRHCNTQAKAA